MNLNPEKYPILKTITIQKQEQSILVEYNNWYLAKTSTSALTAWRRELA